MFKNVIGPGTTCITSLLFLSTLYIAADLVVTILQASNKTDASFEVMGVMTQPPKFRKQQDAPEPSPVGKIAEGFRISVLCPEKVIFKADSCVVLIWFNIPYQSFSCVFFVCG